MFWRLFMGIWCWCVWRVWCDWDWVGSGFEDNWPRGAFDVVVLVGGGYSCRVDPAFRLGGVELESKLVDVCSDYGKSVVDVGVVRDDVDVVHVGGNGRVGSSGA